MVNLKRWRFSEVFLEKDLRLIRFIFHLWKRKSFFIRCVFLNFLPFAGLVPRRKNESLILEGKVLVNGQIVRDLSYKVSPERDQVIVDGKVLKIPPKVYYLFYKPRGYLTSLHDPHHRQTIRAFLEKLPFRVFPVGRLDKDSEGLLLLTNDGDLANQLLHPKYEVRRTYWVWVKPKILENKIKSLLDKGVEIEEKLLNL